MSVCVHCGRHESEHHEFERKMPEGCACSPGTWGPDVTPICERYVGDGSTYCETCEHDKMCHASPLPQHGGDSK